MPQKRKTNSVKSKLNITFRYSKRPLISSIAILLAALSCFLYFGYRIIQLNEIADDAKVIINKWNNLDKNINDILLLHFNDELDGYKGLVQIKSQWAYQTIDFSYSLNELKNNVERNLSHGSIKKINDAFALWNLTKRNLQFAQKTLETILSSEYSNLESLGLLHYYYRYRNTETLSFDSTVNIMNFLNEISIIDVSGNDFSRIMESTVQILRLEIEKQIRIIILLIILIISIILSLFFRLNSLINKSISLEREKRELKLKARSSILSDLLFNENTNEKDYLELNETTENLDLLKPMAFIAFRPERISQIAVNSPSGIPEKNKLIYKLNKILSAIDTGHIAFYYKDDIIAIINFEPETQDDLCNAILAIHSDFTQEISIETLCVYSTAIHDYTQIAECFHKVISASVYKFVYGKGSLINADKIEHHNLDDFDYPIKKEQQINKLIKERKVKQAEEIYEEIIAEVRSRSILIVKMTSIRLVSSMMNTLQLIISNNCLTSLISKLHEDYEIIQLETLSEVKNRIFNLIREVNDQLEQMNSQKHDALIEIIDIEIENNYSDPNMSVDTLADLAQLSPVYLGRIYKKKTARSISDMINERRLTVSCELLSEGALPVHEICKSVGYTNESYFYTLFKKRFGVTPARFRKYTDD